MLEVMQRALECVLSLFLIGLVGYILDKRKWFAPETKTMIPQFVTLITLPPYLFANILNTFNKEELTGLLYGLLIPCLSIAISFGLGLAMARLLKVRRGRKGLFSVGFATSNTIYIGIPVNVALFGPEALPYVLIYFFGNTSFFWTIGNYMLSLDGDREPEPILSLDTLKKVMSPPLIGFLFGVALVLAEFRPPAFFMDASVYIGSVTMPLATIFIGITLASINFRELRLDRDVAVLLLGRFVLCPLTVILLMSLIPIPPLMAKVFIIQSSLPVISSAVLLASYHRSDAQYASVVVSLSTLMALVTIPAYMVIITLLGLD
ncbi:AEC family transporter [Deltaproteobacteria bacterium OttesenSCG-928-M10]|nr:AEC family transporter [Deltaproteobacteria bacterium OttesenSCG-928-M10]